MRIRKMVELRRIREIVDFIETNIHIRRFWTNTYIRSTNTYIRPVPILGVTYIYVEYNGQFFYKMKKNRVGLVLVPT